jgi:uncharacterized protein (TIGR00251 family)
MTVLLKVRVQPNAPRNAVAGFMADDTLKVKVAAPPLDGRANQRLIAYLAECLAVRQSAITIKTGETGRNKLVSIEGVKPHDLHKRLEDLVPCRN